MIPTSVTLPAVLAGGSFRTRFVADLVVEDTVVIPDIPLEDTELTGDGSGSVLTTGKATVVYRDDFGTSIVPRGLGSWLAPFVSRLDVSMLVEVGNQFSEKVLRGRLRVVGVGDVDEAFLKRGRTLYSVGARIPVELADHFHAVDLARFPIPTAPKDLTSVQREMSRLTGLAVSTVVPDGPIPRSVTYEENRLDAVNALAGVLDSFAYVTPDGAVGLTPKIPGPVVLQLRTDGTVIEAIPSGMSDDGVYNQVVVTTYDDEQAAILATASVTSGPLRVGGPFMARPYKASSPYVKTRAQAQAYADSLLPTVSALPAVTWKVTAVPDPRVEVWDVLEVVTETGSIVGQVSKLTFTDDSMVLEMQVIG